MVDLRKVAETEEEKRRTKIESEKNQAVQEKQSKEALELQKLKELYSIICKNKEALSELGVGFGRNSMLSLAGNLRRTGHGTPQVQKTHGRDG